MGDESPELIEQRMEGTRASLTEKVSALEQQVVGTIQQATATVTDTVQTVKAAMHETVSTVKDTVQESVVSVKDTVRETLDVSHHVRQNPWLAVGGSVAAGFLAGWFVFRGREEDHRYEPSRSHSYSGGTGYSPPEPPREQEQRSFFAAAAASTPSWVDNLLQRAGQELQKLGEQALETAVASAKQAMTDKIPTLFEADRTTNGAEPRHPGGPEHGGVYGERGRVRPDLP